MIDKNNYPKVAIGVCTYNRCNDLKRLLNSLEKLNYPNFIIIVVDNNSNDDTEYISKSFRNVKYIIERKQGLAHARNRLIEFCGNDIEYLGILDDDETVNSDWIDRMLDCFRLDSRIVAVGGPYVPIFPKVPPEWMPLDFHAYNVDVKGCKAYKNIGIAGGNNMIKLNAIKKKNIRFNINLGYKGNILLSGEDNEFFDRLVGENDLRGFTEFAFVNHYISESKMKFKWFLKRYLFEGNTQYYRFGKYEYFKNLLQFPIRLLRFFIAFITFNKKIITTRFFKLVMNIGVIIGPLKINKNEVVSSL